MPIDAAGVGLIYNGLILLAKRAEFIDGEPCSFGGYWSIFAGSLEEKEGPMFCAVRELNEESEIKLNIEDLSYAGSIQKEQGGRLHVYFSILHDRPIPVLNYEHTAYCWFKIDDIDTFSEPVDEEIISLLKNHYKVMINGKK